MTTEVIQVWTKDEALAYLIKSYFAPWQLERAQKDFDGMLHHISSSMYGARGGDRPRFETRDQKVHFWAPGPSKWHEPPLFSFPIGFLLRAALPVTKSGQAKLL